MHDFNGTCMKFISNLYDFQSIGERYTLTNMSIDYDNWSAIYGCPRGILITLFGFYV